VGFGGVNPLRSRTQEPVRALEPGAKEEFANCAGLKKASRIPEQAYHRERLA